MSYQDKITGGMPVGHVSDLDATRAAAVLYLRLWGDDDRVPPTLNRTITQALTSEAGGHARQSFEALSELCQHYGRRPLMRHGVMCNCLGADEACFANFVALAAEGHREDAMLIATLLIRADMAPILASLAEDFGLALKRMGLSHAGPLPSGSSLSATVH